MAEAVFQCFFPGYSTTFRQNRQPFSGKPGDPADTNTAGKNDLLRGQNKVERNCRHAQGTQQIKSRSCRTVFLCGSFCFSVLICTPNTGHPVLGGTYQKQFRDDFHTKAKKSRKSAVSSPPRGGWKECPENSCTGICSFS